MNFDHVSKSINDAVRIVDEAMFAVRTESDITWEFLYRAKSHLLDQAEAAFKAEFYPPAEPAQ